MPEHFSLVGFIMCIVRGTKNNEDTTEGTEGAHPRGRHKAFFVVACGFSREY